MPYAYRKSERLRKNHEFASLMKQGKRLSTDGLSLFYAPNSGTDFRVGVSVGRKLANAVNRNRLKRRLRAAAALGLAGTARGYDLVFVARQGLVTADFERIRGAVAEALRRSVLRGGIREDASQ